MAKDVEVRLRRLGAVWRRTCPVCADDGDRTYVAVTPEELEGLAAQEGESSDLPARWCPECGRRLGPRLYVGIDVDRV